MRTRILTVAAIIVAAAQPFQAQYAVPTFVIAGGGGAATDGGGTYTLTGTIGQPEASTTPMLGGTYKLIGGWWPTLKISDFTDDPLTSGTSVIKVTHLTQLRTRINALRVRFSLTPATWTDASPAGAVTIIKGVHVQEMRDKLVEAYQAAVAPPPSFTDAALQTNVTAVKVVHIAELRQAVIDLEYR